MPMGLNCTRFISYLEINVEGIDLVEDAWGLNSDFYDVIEFLGLMKAVPGKSLTKKLIEEIRKQV